MLQIIQCHCAETETVGTNMQLTVKTCLVKCNAMDSFNSLHPCTALYSTNHLVRTKQHCKHESKSELRQAVKDERESFQ